jgi:hypothetical protein
MKNKLLILLLCGFCVTLYAETKKKKEVAKEKVSEAKEAVTDYAYTQKDEFVSKMKLELAGFKNDLAELDQKVKETTGTMKTEAENKILKIKLDVKKLNKRIENVKNSSESEWDGMKNKFKDSMSDAKESIAKSRQWLSEKIAP